MKTTLEEKCPCCDRQLVADGDGAGRFVAWCACGECISQKSSNGALGDTPKEAGENLVRIINQEIEETFDEEALRRHKRIQGRQRHKDSDVQ